MITLLLNITLWLYIFWLMYILVMGMYRAKLDGRLTGTRLVLAYPAIIIAVLVDWITNWTIAAVVFAELPKSGKELVTQRLTRYLLTDTGWRYKMASWICSTLLDVFDPKSKHCV